MAQPNPSRPNLSFPGFYPSSSNSFKDSEYKWKAGKIDFNSKLFAVPESSTEKEVIRTEIINLIDSLKGESGVLEGNLLMTEVQFMYHQMSWERELRCDRKPRAS
ncbi:hypothetical protein PTTG_28795 [Puccinia triticina 1-1 BBBD Race 1]|uniref:Uncharacterized protein n=2 Tax=Puccinia triticina TaxID=208348 RepID=A0A180G8T7_PUCT1|nr:uncharacterized protein PtA15_11A135 [Puccinia triticina]OAV89125.1 hypothetical protein PTTG_28795 [Puccinia triticina 1-1 BBBD Race 1]WAQ89447.1 hypothetical protein PtA15_11A135 [Puccinia triticina]WAR59505.1 hypothetical protein PtB15_11B145 [Puccinia triticina]